MQEFDYDAYKKMVKIHQDNNQPTQWCDSIYQDAKGDYTKVFWADLEPSSYLVQWLQDNPIKTSKKAIVIGCGVGDDCEALSQFGFEVIGFDIAPTAIELCKKRYPNSKVDYQVANLFDYPKEWKNDFDVIYECNTIQILANDYRIQARKAISSLLTQNGHLLVSCRSRNANEQLDAIPLPLDKEEINQFVVEDKLTQKSFLAYDDTQDPPIPHFFAV